MYCFEREKKEKQPPLRDELRRNNNNNPKPLVAGLIGRGQSPFNTTKWLNPQ
jgi:hypothetical protein